jgi:gas vesicle protein
MSSGKVLLGVLAGVAAGAFLGILFAPDKGVNTRKKIMSKGDDFAEGLKGKFNEFLDQMEGKYSEVKDNAEDLVEAGKAKFQETKTDFKNQVNDKVGQIAQNSNR